MKQAIKIIFSSRGRHNRFPFPGNFPDIQIAGPGAQRKVIDVPEAGLTMHAPSGWRVHGGQAALICSKNDNTGVMVIEPLEGKVFGEYARELAAQFGGNVISITPLSVSGHDDPMQGSKSLRIYIHRNDELIEISFTTLAGDFAKYESSLQDSLASIDIR